MGQNTAQHTLRAALFAGTLQTRFIMKQSETKAEPSADFTKKHHNHVCLSNRFILKVGIHFGSITA